MISRILISILLLASISAKERTTSLTFFAEFEDDQAEDFIELGLSVRSEGNSLVKAMEEASKIADEVKSIATDFCQAHLKNKKQSKTACKDIVQIGNYQIQPKYQIVKRQSKFMGFEVVHQVTIKVLAVDDISDLADQILKLQDVKILSFEWKPIEEENAEQAAVKQGVEQGEGLCHQIGMHLIRTVNVEQVQVQGEDQNAVYKFQIQCGQGQKVRQKKTDQKKKDVKQEKKADKKQKDDSKDKEDKKDDSKEKEDKKQKDDKKDEKKQKKKDEL